MVMIGEKKSSIWGVVTSYTIGAPPVRMKTYSVPGRFGSIDATEALTGYPVYDDRSVELKITVYDKVLAEYQRVYDDIYAYCHGRRRNIVFPFDSDFYYDGRMKVSVSQEDKKHGIVTITADCYPYALKKELTEVNISCETADAREVRLINSGMPTKLTVETDAEIELIRELTGRVVFSPGKHLISYPLLSGSGETVTLEGNANVTISYREGKI